jgi:YidC/Oxa1 family membrane protein insertase
MKKLISGIVFCVFIFACGIVNADITAVNGESKNFTLGSTAAKENPYKLELSLTSKGAAISTAKFRDYTNRNRKNPQPFDFLAPFDNVVSLESRRLMLPEVEKSFPLNRLNWVSDGVKKSDGSETISFNAVILQDDYEFLKITKTFALRKDDYTIDCNVTITNLSKDEVKVALEMLGPAGITKEDPRVDVRTVTAGFINPATNIIEVTKKNIKDTLKEGGKVKMLHKNAEFKFMWIAASDKYFTSIIRPVPTDSNLYSNWIASSYAITMDPDPSVKDDENLGVMLETQNVSIAAGKEITYKYQIYIGPKDKNLFNSNVLYKQLGFINTIDFQACCWVVGFGWLSFFILDAMDWLYNYIPNYGVIIIIFVLVVRVILHPITKKSQVSMMGMAKLGPMAEEIKKKYADNKAEMQKHMARLYREQGIAPMLGCLPMFLQMPIWVALYSAINTGIEFRGAEFLPFWITDLSQSDTLFYLPAVVEKIPLIGSMIGTSFNLLPILLGVAMFAQQKLMPSTAPATNPQAAQQQKMMLWMMPVMMLIFLYRAPSGLNLYIMASTAAGVVEQYVIRKHIKEREVLEEQGLVPTTSKLGGKLKKKKPKPPIKFS